MNGTKSTGGTPEFKRVGRPQPGVVVLSHWWRVADHRESDDLRSGETCCCEIESDWRAKGERTEGTLCPAIRIGQRIVQNGSPLLMSCPLQTLCYLWGTVVGNLPFQAADWAASGTADQTRPGGGLVRSVRVFTLCLAILLSAAVVAADNPAYQKGTLTVTTASGHKSYNSKARLKVYQIGNCGDFQNGQEVEFLVKEDKIYIAHEGAKDYK